MHADRSTQSCDDAACALGQSLETLYRGIFERSMHDLPICNPALTVAASGFRSYGGRAIGIVTTPWFMNLVAADLPEGRPAPAIVPGTTIRIGLPAGEVDFITGELEGFGRLDCCSLFSPVFEFGSMDAALQTAEEAARAFFDPSLLEEPPRPPAEVNRRDLLRGRIGQPEDAGP
ncbi:[NiFe]-hydrogenase assembly chaperone HybE [Rhizobium sp. CG5]|uniref:[NiFe]-hydrogenase assembly chaperone HybE n=1 Tax=Rhizobium sp. CG5 TaxID=2726076 RepID=UPI0020341F4C|nr:[NiFe]-hydrogenase assembly chaperone HybE [Rhizobium sp. CG5]MCM2474433.1 [NiFe]-hydrogenase assembly chaperone HybE [Rhizobium sp. CG5]